MSLYMFSEPVYYIIFHKAGFFPSSSFFFPSVFVCVAGRSGDGWVWIIVYASYTVLFLIIIFSINEILVPEQFFLEAGFDTGDWC